MRAAGAHKNLSEHVPNHVGDLTWITGNHHAAVAKRCGRLSNRAICALHGRPPTGKSTWPRIRIRFVGSGLFV